MTASPSSQTLVVALYYAVFAAGVRAVQSIDAMAVIYMSITVIWLIIALRFVNPAQIVTRAKQQSAAHWMRRVFLKRPISLRRYVYPLSWKLNHVHASFCLTIWRPMIFRNIYNWYHFSVEFLQIPHCELVSRRSLNIQYYQRHKISNGSFVSDLLTLNAICLCSG